MIKLWIRQALVWSTLPYSFTLPTEYTDSYLDKSKFLQLLNWASSRFRCSSRLSGWLLFYLLRIFRLLLLVFGFVTAQLQWIEVLYCSLERDCFALTIDDTYIGASTLPICAFVQPLNYSGLPRSAGLLLVVDDDDVSLAHITWVLGELATIFARCSQLQHVLFLPTTLEVMHHHLHVLHPLIKSCGVWFRNTEVGIICSLNWLFCHLADSSAV